MSQNPALAYRPDIDGLRAIAVLSVVFYHFGIGGLSGGFVGVDVFYVISGFLITGIIQREIEQGRFTFAGFYERRVRRIFPALFVVLAATLAVGTVILLPTDLILLGKSTLATLLFSSNILFWRTSGYFDGNSELNPLLHTWSLAVEEQFYIGLPVLLLLVYRFARGWLKPILIISAILSFAACLWMQGFRPTAAFYLSPFRAWELLLGSCIAVGNLPQVVKPWLREALAWLGLILLVLSIVFIKAGPEFPGWQALGPVIGTGLLIYAGGTGRTKINSLLSVKPVVFIGLISYSLYLWHWPVVVYAKYANGLELFGSQAWSGIVLSLLLAIASYYWVETPFRNNKNTFTRPKLFVGAVAVSLLLCVAGGFVWQGNGLPKRLPEEVVALDQERNPSIPFLGCGAKGIVDSKLNSQCILGDRLTYPTIIIWGDSHALSWAPAFDAVLKEKKISGVLAYNSACAPLNEMVNPISPSCYDRNSEIYNFIAKSKKINHVVMVASWTSYSNEPGQYSIQNTAGDKGNLKVFPPLLLKTISDLKSKNKKIWLIGPVPGAPSDAPMRMAFAKLRYLDIPQEKNYEEVKRQSIKFYEVAKTVDGIHLTNPENWLCNALTCKYLANGFLLYRDGGHLNVRGAMYLKPELILALEEFMK